MQKTEGRIDHLASVKLVQGMIEYGEGNYNAAIEKFRELSALQPNNQAGAEPAGPVALHDRRCRGCG